MRDIVVFPWHFFWQTLTTVSSIAPKNFCVNNRTITTFPFSKDFAESTNYHPWLRTHKVQCPPTSMNKKQLSILITEWAIEIRRMSRPPLRYLSPYYASPSSCDPLFHTASSPRESRRVGGASPNYWDLPFRNNSLTKRCSDIGGFAIGFINGPTFIPTPTLGYDASATRL